jgi:hypothetical protein
MDMDSLSRRPPTPSSGQTIEFVRDGRKMMEINNSCEGLSRMARAARARARGTRAHVRNVPSPVPPNSTVRNLESSCTGCMFLLFGGL